MTPAETKAQYRIEQARHWVQLAREGKSTSFALTMIEMHLQRAHDLLTEAKTPEREVA